MPLRPCRPGKIRGLKNDPICWVTFILTSTHSFLGCSGISCGDGSSLGVSQWALLTGVACSKGLIVSVNNPVWCSHFAHVQERVPSGVHGGYWLHPCTRSLTHPRVWIGAGDIHAHIVNPLWESPILGAAAGVITGYVGVWCLIYSVPVTKVLKVKILHLNS